MRDKGLKHVLLLVLMVLAFFIAGCGGDDDNGNRLVRLNLSNLGQLATGFNYAAWVQSGDRTSLLRAFTPDINGGASFSQFTTLDSLNPGDRIFVTIESSITQPRVPSAARVLDGTFVGNIANLNFPRLREFETAVGFVTVTSDGRQLLAEYSGLPDVSDLNMVYQGFLLRNGAATPLRTFDFRQVPVSDTVPFDATTAQYVLTIRPVIGIDPNRPYSIQPFFSNIPLLPLVAQPLVKSSLTPGVGDFRFPFGTATLP